MNSILNHMKGKMNCRKIGREFEIEAFEILKKKFDSVEWLSKKTISSFDFKCMKDGKIYFGDAKVINNSNKPSLKYSQKEADFVIAKIKGNVKYIPKEKFFEELGKICLLSTTIQISDKLWEELNRRKKKRGETFEDVILYLLNKEKTRK